MYGNRRPWLAALVFGVVVFGALDPLPMGRISSYARPDWRVPAYPQFLTEVAARTPPGATVVLAVPIGDGEHGYDTYAFFRATYLLAGRRVIPLMDPDGRVHPERLHHRSNFIAAWRTPLPPGAFEPIWQGHGGTLSWGAP